MNRNFTIGYGELLGDLLELQVENRHTLRQLFRSGAPLAFRLQFFLQAGAFQSVTDAENLKAKIAFSGFEANVRPVNLSDKGTLYRVRLGPYKSPDEVNRIKLTLSQNGINAAVVKAAD